MKTKKILLILVLAILLIPVQAFAKTNNYFTIYMDSVQDADTVGVCNNLDSVKLVAMKGLTQSNWTYYKNNQQIIDYSDTLYMKWNYSSVLTYQGFDGKNWQSKMIGVLPLKFSITQDWDHYQYITCNSTTNLNVLPSFNYKDKGQYSWTPVKGLSNPGIANPVATITSNIKYTVTFTISEGCFVKDSIDIVMHPMGSPSICIVSVDNTNKNQIIWDKPVTQSIDSFYIYKETNVTNEYKKIGTVAYNSNNVFTDTASQPDVQSNRYEISFKDVCGMKSTKSLTHKTMHLSVNKGQNATWNLIWEPYEGFTVTSYNIYRGTTANDLQLIGSASGSGATQYSDLTPPTGDLYYQVEVVSPNACNQSGSTLKSAVILSSSRSNIADNMSTGINKITTTSFIVYPNPAIDQLFVESKQNSVKGIIDITNISGQQVLTYPLNTQKSNIDISSLKNGLYLVKIATESGVTTQKFIKK